MSSRLGDGGGNRRIKRQNRLRMSEHYDGPGNVLKKKASGFYGIQCKKSESDLKWWIFLG